MPTHWKGLVAGTIFIVLALAMAFMSQAVLAGLGFQDADLWGFAIGFVPNFAILMWVCARHS
jgi:tetrahydromethanopterin S-methyltransferase subunit F